MLHESNLLDVVRRQSWTGTAGVAVVSVRDLFSLARRAATASSVGAHLWPKAADSIIRRK